MLPVPDMAAFSVSPSLDEASSSLDGVHVPASASSILVPIVSEQIADLETPVSAFLKLRSFPSRHSLPSVPLANVGSGGVTPASSEGESNYAFLLESVEGGERLARYSIVGFAPHGILAVGAAPAAVAAARSRGAADTIALSGDPLAHVEAWLAKQHLVTPPALRGLPSTAFCGGAVGYVAYDAVRHFEPRTAPKLAAQADALGVPEAVFLQCDDLLLFDHVRHTIRVVVHIRLDAPAGAAAEATRKVSFHRDIVAAAYAGAVERIAAISAALAGPLPAGFSSGPRHSPSAPLSPAASAAAAAARDLEAGSNMGRAVYEDAVRTLKGHIVEGDIIQAVPSHRIMHELPAGERKKKLLLAAAAAQFAGDRSTHHCCSDHTILLGHLRLLLSLYPHFPPRPQAWAPSTSTATCAWSTPRPTCSTSTWGQASKLWAPRRRCW